MTGFSQLNENKGKMLVQLLAEFKALRRKNIDILRSKGITDADLDKSAIHPELGAVTLRNLLAMWPTHDLAHDTESENNGNTTQSAHRALGKVLINNE